MMTGNQSHAFHGKPQYPLGPFVQFLRYDLCLVLSVILISPWCLQKNTTLDRSWFFQIHREEIKKVLRMDPGLGGSSDSWGCPHAQVWWLMLSTRQSLEPPQRPASEHVREGVSRLGP